MIYPHFDLENECWQKGYKRVAGIDEAGRGPLAGPVVAAAVLVEPSQMESIKGQKEHKLVRDSKTLSAKQRERAFDFITSNFSFGIGWSSEITIDRINILQATYLAMKKALSDARSKLKEEPDFILIDGRAPLPNISIKQKYVVRGDSIVFSIAAASVLAKVSRDRQMLRYHAEFPDYGFDRHKGYGTKAHFEMLKEFGPCKIHRKSFNLGLRTNHSR
ncbi:MAG: ribonuclease HII [Parcubacteria group bacterium]|jgi:ribonuclease HII